MDLIVFSLLPTAATYYEGNSSSNTLDFKCRESLPDDVFLQEGYHFRPHMHGQSSRRTERSEVDQVTL
jgi:hypothetical protein